MSPVIQNKLSQPRQAGGWKFYNCVCVAKMATDQTCVLPLLSVSVLLWQTVLLIAVPAFKNIALFLRKTSSLSEKKKITVYRYVLRESDWRSRYYMSPGLKNRYSVRSTPGRQVLFQQRLNSRQSSISCNVCLQIVKVSIGFHSY